MIDTRPVNTDFLQLCHAQMTLLAEQFGAAVSVVYLTEQLENGEAKLVPIVAYPDTVSLDRDLHLHRATPALIPEGQTIVPESTFSLPQATPFASRSQRAIATITGEAWPQGEPEIWATDRPDANPPEADPPEADYPSEDCVNRALPPEQLVLPLVYEGVVLGLLVTGRDDRPWSGREQTQMAPIAETIAIACVLNQREVWLQEQFQHQQQQLVQQQETTATLLHQFRNPLTALRTFGKLLLRRLQPEDPNRNLAHSILRESDRLQELAQQLDDAVTIEVASLSLPAAVGSSPRADQPPVSAPLPQLAAAPPPPGLPPAPSLTSTTPLAVEACDLDRLLFPLLDSALAIAQDRALQLTVSLPDPLPQVWANPIALREVISNLLDNALKYTPAPGQIWVHGEVREHGYPPTSNLIGDDVSPVSPRPATQPSFRLAISDTGPGIPATDQAHLFERHYRGVQAQSGIPGTGLGLAIVRDLLQRMQGDIEIFSPARFPRDTPALPAIADTNPLASVGTTSVVGTTAVVWLPIVGDSQ